jgi:phospholipid/cholesterol/gamma-HCH transport system substrate-binding protein
MATAAPPTPPPGSSAPPPSAPRRASRRANAARIAAVGALAAVAVILLVLVLGGKGGATYQLIFPEAGQLVRGDEVQVGGTRVGSVTDIELTSDYRARVTVHLDSSLTSLREGTGAEIRVPSLVTVADRYVALSLGPNNRRALPSGSTLQGSAIHSVVDLDQLFNIFNARTRKGLQQFFQGSAEQYAGAAAALQTDVNYFPPSLAAASHVFAELARETPTLTRFLVESAKAVTTIAARHTQLTELVSNANTTFAAIGSQQSNLAHGFRELPGALEEGNRTFRQLPGTLAALRKLVDVSKPNTKTLAPFFADLRPLFRAATPVVREFSEAIERPGANNDLTEVALALPALAKTLSSASPDSVRSLEESLPVTALFGPYTPDLEGTIRTFGQGDAYYDASGHYVRGGTLFPDFALEGNTLKPANPQRVLQGLKTHQLRRCPGSATQPAPDGSSPFTNNGALGCDPTQVP